MCEPDSPGQSGGEGSSASPRSAGVVCLFPASTPQNTGEQMLSKRVCGSETHPSMAGRVTELLNKATSALNFEPDSAGTGVGGWGMGGSGTHHCEEDISAIPAPKGENTTWEGAKN